MDSALDEFTVQSTDHPGAGDIHKWRIGKVTHDQPNLRDRMHPFQHDAVHMFDVEVQQRGLDAKYHNARQIFVVRMTLKVRKTSCPWNAPEKRYVRTCNAGDQHQERRNGSNEYALQDSQ